MEELAQGGIKEPFLGS